jgi:hypothetical protein
MKNLFKIHGASSSATKIERQCVCADIAGQLSQFILGIG